MSRIDERLNKRVVELLTNAGIKGDEFLKWNIVYNSYYNAIKKSLDKGKVSYDVREEIISKFILFTIQFETVCIKAFRPISGSLSTAQDIISMYSGRNRELNEKEHGSDAFWNQIENM